MRLQLRTEFFPYGPRFSVLSSPRGGDTPRRARFLERLARAPHRANERRTPAAPDAAGGHRNSGAGADRESSLELWELLGGQLEKQSLNPRVTGQLQRNGYRIEKLVFESISGVHVTANLYLPVSGKPPFPAILAPVGHSPNGKAYRAYQHFYQNMARQGYVVLTYDPWGQGERLQYIDPKTGSSHFEPTGEHSQAGRPMTLLGDSFALYCTWDGIRGIDYLLTRPEVDPERLGCTGQSGGGTMTMYLAALEPRLRAAVAMPEQRPPLSQTILSSNVRNGIVVEEVQFESQTGIRVPGRFLRPSSSHAQYPAILGL